ncbi:SusC/RagA family TonB-linked outer membrane protein [Sphingobacterium olei]|uniref:SusC/RagA family TonB-linked outer membrane protein n=1 Tax=Sphingobacterium olei TaxID=2571155 RepID=A0A4U0P0I6_9SPHI|nr:SusC/RagA family TonB-linked outer membrane protein [Sphingobacterium olei]TJZ60655.1 SusC/RagA family TonB-linked outer membrane protein [Sphingobacterium olei]
MSKFYLKCCYLSLFMLLSITTLFAQQSVTGIVSDANGIIPGVTVSVSSTSRVTQTDANGKYTIQASNGEKIRFTMIGYTSQELTVSSTTHNIVLQEDAGSLDEVVVTAMGITRDQRKLGYAVSTIKNEEIVQASPTNFGSALYGKAPGVSISTSAGGGSSAVSIDIRGNMNSIGFQSQPLIVVDGVITRNEAVNNGGFWNDQRIRGNGILDINPENIESINILKGAAASALYGSDASSGVIVITTKSGKGVQGIGIDFNASYGLETVGVIPDYQFEFGPGYARTINRANFNANDEGFIERTISNGRIWFGTPNQSSTFNIAAPSGYSDGDIISQPILSAWGQFGPRFNGQDAIYWDGQIRNYVAYKDNYKNFYRNGHSGIYNLAIANSNEKTNYRFSYTRNDYQSMMESGPQNKNTFNLNANYILSPKLEVGLIANYTSEHVNNRPQMIDRMTNNYTGFLSPAQDIRWFEQNYQTSKGYKYVTFGDRIRDPEEAFIFGTAGGDYLDYFWNQRAKQYDEYTNRVIASTTANYKILDNLSLRGRIGTDYTGYLSENRQPNEFPTAIGTSGSFNIQSNKMQILYGDLLLSYNTKLSNSVGLQLQAGYQGRKEEYNWYNIGTVGGLSEENWFSLRAANENSRVDLNQPLGKQTLVKDGLFGVATLDLFDYWFLEGSIRQERTSSLFPGNNVFYYPSVSTAFELNKALDLPEFINYSKLRASYGVVGNPPTAYTANRVYTALTVSGTPTLVLPSEPFGNDNLKNETKREFEIGLENRWFNNKFGFDLTYYNNRIVDMIVPLDVAHTTGVERIIQNVGNMKNYGLEVGLNYTPIKNDNFMWDSRFNISFNRNKLTALADNLERLEHTNVDNGSLYVRSEVGKAAGDIYTYQLKRHENGQLLVGDDGYYIPDYDNLAVVGNIQAKGVGGFINNFTYKDFSVNTVIDFRYGGQVYSPSIQYGISAGMYKETLFGRDESTGGLPYYVDGNGDFIQVNGSAPTGRTVYHDGMVLEGVTATGQQNDQVIESKEYYRLAHYWGQYPGSNRPGTYETAVFDNNFIRMREIAISYRLPNHLSTRLKTKNLVISAYGRNLFFLHKTLPHLDPEATVGTTWLTRANVGNAGMVPRSFGLSVRASF